MSTEWNRPRMQRHELGPIMHDLGHDVYDDMEQRLPHDPIQPAPVDMPTLLSFANICVVRATDAVSRLPVEKVQELDRLITEKHRSPHDTQELTYYNNVREVLYEGMATGVVSPLELYQTIKIAETQQADGRYDMGSLSIDPQDAATRIQTEGFQVMLDQLARGYNGSMGSAASDMAGLINLNILSNFDAILPPETVNNHLRSFKSVMILGIENAFKIEAGQVTGFSDLFLHALKERKSVERNSGKFLAASGGCPVRHAEFPVLGEYARRHFAAVGDPEEGPRNQGESLITRASRFVSAALLRSTEGVQS